MCLREWRNAVAKRCRKENLGKYSTLNVVVWWLNICIMCPARSHAHPSESEMIRICLLSNSVSLLFVFCRVTFGWGIWFFSFSAERSNGFDHSSCGPWSTLKRNEANSISDGIPIHMWLYFSPSPPFTFCNGTVGTSFSLHFSGNCDRPSAALGTQKGTLTMICTMEHREMSKPSAVDHFGNPTARAVILSWAKCRFGEFLFAAYHVSGRIRVENKSETKRRARRSKYVRPIFPISHLHPNGTTPTTQMAGSAEHNYGQKSDPAHFFLEKVWHAEGRNAITFTLKTKLGRNFRGSFFFSKWSNSRESKFC